MISAIEYTRELGQALGIQLANNPDGLYAGREGAMRLAREYGYGLADYPEKEARDALGRSYGLICVIGYDLKPPLDAKEWVREVQKEMKRKREDDKSWKRSKSKEAFGTEDTTTSSETQTTWCDLSASM